MSTLRFSCAVAVALACAVTCIGSLENMGAELPAYSTKFMRVTNG